MTSAQNHAAQDNAKDPVCGMTVEIASAKAQVEHLGQVYYFCYVGCADKFRQDPDAYLNPDRKKKVEAISGSGYTCPMHPEIVSDKPDDCPLCGMSLEPMMPTGEGNEEVASIKKRLTWSILLALPLALLSMGHMVGIHIPISDSINNWLQLALATPIVFWIGLPFIHRGLQSVKNKALNMFTLLSLGIVIPYMYSVVVLLSQGVAHANDAMLYFESSAIITTLAWLGQLLEAKARVASSGAVKELVGMMPDEATVILPDGSPLTMKVSDIPIGAEVRIKPGDRIPVDGQVLEGTSFVDESMLTGEPTPVFKSAGSTVSTGTINGNGSLLVEAKQIGNNTLLAQIIDLVTQAQRSRLPVQLLVDKVAAVFVPAVIAISVVTFLIWFNMQGLVQALSMAVAVLVVACPCALGLATPMSVVVAAGRAAKAGVLFKDASSLEALSAIDTLVIDKTGTITEGRMQLTSITSSNSFSEDNLLRLATAVEALSEHPLAQALVVNAVQRGVEPGKCNNFKYQPGSGVSGTVNNHQVVIGTLAHLEQIAPGSTKSAPITNDTNSTHIFIAIDDKCEGRFDFADKVRDDAAQSVKQLQDAGIKVVLATGDKQQAAQAIAASVGITEVHASMMPADKARLVKDLQATGAKVAMAGDGINDAPALAQANVGIAMAAGTSIAVHSAGIVLLNSDVAGIVRARKVSKAMLKNIGENLVLAFGYNVLAIPSAAGLFIPIAGFAINPMTAAAAMSVSSVSVIANALRLRRLKL